MHGGDEVGDHVLALLGCYYNEENIEECPYDRGIMESKNLLIPLDDEISISEENFIECTEGDEVRDHVLALFGCYYNEENIDECLDDQGDNGVKEFIDSVLQDDEIAIGGEENFIECMEGDEVGDDQGDNEVEEFIDSVLQDDEIEIGEENFIECMDGDEVRDHVLALLGCSYNEENIDECLDDQGDNGVKEFIDSVLQDDEIATGEENFIECMEGDEVGDDQGDNEVEEFIDSVLQDDEIEIGEENFIECMDGDEVRDHVLALFGCYYNEENIDECLDDQGDNGVKEFIDSVLQDDEIATGEENFIECLEGDEVGECMDGYEVRDHVLALLGSYYNEENIDECVDDQGDNGVKEFIDSVLQDVEIATEECLDDQGDNGVKEFIDSILQDDEIAIGEENFIECMERDEVGDHVLALLGCSYNEENIEECLDYQGIMESKNLSIPRILKNAHMIREIMESKNLLIPLQDDEISISEENFIECTVGDEVRDHVMSLLGCFYNEENIEECLDDQGDNGVEEFIDSVLLDDELAIGEENFIECMDRDEVGDHVLALLGCYYNEESIEECPYDQGDNGKNIEECLDDQGDNEVEEFIDSVLQDDEIEIGEENFIECMDGDEVRDHVLALFGCYYNEENIDECLDDHGDNGVKEFIDSVLQDDEIATGEENFIECMEGDEVGDDQGDNEVEEFIDSVLQDDEIEIGEENFIACMDGDEVRDHVLALLGCYYNEENIDECLDDQGDNGVKEFIDSVLQDDEIATGEENFIECMEGDEVGECMDGDEVRDHVLALLGCYYNEENIDECVDDQGDNGVKEFIDSVLQDVEIATEECLDDQGDNGVKEFIDSILQDDEIATGVENFTECMERDEVGDHVSALLGCSYNEENIEECLDYQGDNGVEEFINSVLQDDEIKIGEVNFIECMDGDEVRDHVLALLGCSYNVENFEEFLGDQGDNRFEEFIDSVLQDDEIEIGQENFIECMEGDEVGDHVLTLLGCYYNKENIEECPYDQGDNGENIEECLDDQGDNGVEEFIDSVLLDDELAIGVENFIECMDRDEVGDHVLALLGCYYNEENIEECPYDQGDNGENIEECLDDQGDNEVEEFIDSVLQDDEIEIGEENFIECMDGDEVRDHVLALFGCYYNEENIDECLDDQGYNRVEEFIDSVLQDDEIATGEENFTECMEGDEVGDHVLALLGCSYNEENIEECLDYQGDNGVEEFINSILQDDEIKIGEVNFIECMDGDEVRDHVLALLGCSYNEENFEECQGDQGDNRVEEFIDSVLQDDEIEIGQENFIECMDGDEVRDHVLALFGCYYNEENIDECLDDHGDNGVKEFIDSVLQDDEIATDDQGDNEVEEFIDSVLQDDEIEIGEENFIECMDGDEVRDHVLALFGCYYNEENIDECLDDQGDNGVKEFIDSVLQDDEIATGEENFIECMEGDEVGDDQGDNEVKEFIDSVLQDDEIEIGEENFIECMDGDEVRDHVLALLGCSYNEENIDECLDDQGDNGVKEFIDSVLQDVEISTEECLDDQGDNGVEEFIDFVLQDDEIATGVENFTECMEGDEVGDHVLALLGCSYNEENIEECLDYQGDNGVEEFINSVLQDDEIKIGEVNFIECMDGDEVRDHVLALLGCSYNEENFEECQGDQGDNRVEEFINSVLQDDEIEIGQENFIECMEGDEVGDHVLTLLGCYYNKENIEECPYDQGDNGENIEECLDDQGDNGVKEFIDSVLLDDELAIGVENFIECMDRDEVGDHVHALLGCYYNEENIEECPYDQGDNGENIEECLEDQGDNEVEEFIDSVLQDDEIEIGEENFIECMDGDEVRDHVLALLGCSYNEENIDECLDDQGDNGVKEFIDSVLQDVEIAAGEENFLECMEGDEVGDVQGDNEVKEFINSVLQDDEIEIGEENFIECMDGDEVRDHVLALLGCSYNEENIDECLDDQGDNGVKEFIDSILQDVEIATCEENFIERMEGDEVGGHVLALLGYFYNEDNIEECLDDHGDNGVEEFIDSVLQDDEIATDYQGDNGVEEFINSVLQDDEIKIGEVNFIECMDGDEVRDHVLALLGCSYNEENFEECLGDQGDNRVEEFINYVLEDDEIEIENIDECLDDRGDNGVKEFIDSVLQDVEIATCEENFIECMEGDEVGGHVLALLGYFYNEDNIEECLDDHGDNGVKEFIDSVLQDDEIEIGEENFIECMDGDEVRDHVLALLGCSYNEENIDECLDDRGDNGVKEFIDSVLQDVEIATYDHGDNGVKEFIDSVLQDDEIEIGEENFIECMDGDEVRDHVLALLGCSYNEENIDECLDDRGIMELKNLSIPFYKMLK
ncbi:hypothetical protein RND71_026480 [Anisodus tanguticus]|uniref:Uncharacterized protein n=1 Tax=Anisodus tanguticus TaxID=243964 RepID=A0AAE1RMD9_9SOLA|nr:hypothetical protein RND71_026480 [Anisodus tanguticus]